MAAATLVSGPVAISVSRPFPSAIADARSSLFRALWGEVPGRTVGDRGIEDEVDGKPERVGKGMRQVVGLVGHGNLRYSERVQQAAGVEVRLARQTARRCS